MAAWTFTRGKKLPLRGVQAGLGLLQEVWLPLLFGFMLAGLFDVLISRELLVNWMGEESGVQDILVVWLVGLADTMRDVYRLPCGRLALEGRDWGVGPRSPSLPPSHPSPRSGCSRGRSRCLAGPLSWPGRSRACSCPRLLALSVSATLRPVSSIMRPSLRASPRR